METNAKKRLKQAVSETVAFGSEYISLGLKVIPLKERSKKPRQKGWPTKGVSDPSRIRRWPHDWRNSNIGILTTSNLIVVDVDPRNDGSRSLDMLFEKYCPFPETATAVTGSGGTHYLFRVKGRTKISCRRGIRPGIDIKAEGGYIVAPPSLHPVTGAKYTWHRPPSQGIAEIPKWLLKLVRKPKAKARPRLKENSQRLVLLGGCKRGDKAALVNEMINRFPICEPGRRHDQMTLAVGSLVGRGFGDNLIVEVLMQWRDIFHREGRTLTSDIDARSDLLACIASTHANPQFGPARGSTWHLDRYSRIRLNPQKRRSLQSPIMVDAHGTKVWIPERPLGKERTKPTGKSVTHSGKRLCMSVDEEVFVEALIIHVTHKRRDLGETTIKMIDDQVREIAKMRNGPNWRAWDNQQIDRLKKKYIRTLDKDASRFELLRMIQRGQRPTGRIVGIPSEYETTGIEGLLRLNARQVICAA